jgi:coenzyme F420-reducing hydrogenase delta subunit
MESLRNDEAQLKWEQSIQKIKEYLKSLFLKKHKRNTKKISDKTNDELTKIIEQTEEEFDIDNEDGENQQ